MERQTIIIIGVIAVVVILLGALFFWPYSSTAPVNQNPVVAPDIEVFSPTANQEISSPVTITGIVRGNGWIGFEGQVGTVQLLDANDQVVAQAPLTATTDWMQLPINFQTTLTFVDPNDGVAKLVFRNENPSGDPAKDKTYTVQVTSPNYMAYQNNLKNLGK